MERRTPLTRRTPMPRTGIRRGRAATPTRQEAAGGDPGWAPARRLALTRDAHLCVRCAQPAVEVHHRRIRGMGGHADHGLANLVSLCWSCHREWVHGALTRLVAEEHGYIVRRWQDPAEVPVLTIDGPARLTDGGAVIRLAAAA